MKALGIALLTIGAVNAGDDNVIYGTSTLI